MKCITIVVTIVKSQYNLLSIIIDAVMNGNDNNIMIIIIRVLIKRNHIKANIYINERIIEF